MTLDTLTRIGAPKRQSDLARPEQSVARFCFWRAGGGLSHHQAPPPAPDRPACQIPFSAVRRQRGFLQRDRQARPGGRRWSLYDPAGLQPARVLGLTQVKDAVAATVVSRDP